MWIFHYDHVKYFTLKMRDFIDKAKKSQNKHYILNIALSCDLIEILLFSLHNYIVTNINLQTNNAAITVITISFLVYFLVNNAIITYAIAPIPIPFDIE